MKHLQIDRLELLEGQGAEVREPAFLQVHSGGDDLSEPADQSVLTDLQQQSVELLKGISTVMRHMQCPCMCLGGWVQICW